MGGLMVTGLDISSIPWFYSNESMECSSKTCWIKLEILWVSWVFFDGSNPMALILFCLENILYCVLSQFDSNAHQKQSVNY
mmetsp:Transcript_54111/g.65328  ORF Transcript_54111/g.65328 Transcript_54111/m.65328 type:complete len:81 (+) Transcript_54111:585-827(+)